MKKRIAIIGAGVSGLTAGFLLHKKYNISLYEKSERIGGNAYTFNASKGEITDIAVAAFGKAGYPNFYKLLKKLNVKSSLCLSSYMSFHNKKTSKGLYITPTFKGLLTQRFAMLHPRYLFMLMRLFASIRKGKKLNENGSFDGLTMEEALKKLPKLHGEPKTILICALCLMSSMKANDIMKAPASFFFEKLKHHHDVVSMKAVYSVRAMKKGTRSYIQKLAEPIRSNIHLRSAIKTIKRDSKGITLVFKNGKNESFDHLIFACHADQAYKMLEVPNSLENELLGIWKYNEGSVVVHRDSSAFPKRSLTQAYTFIYDENGTFNTSVNGALWHEPSVPKKSVLYSSQYPNFEIDPDKIELKTVLRTPVFDFNTCPIIKKLPKLNGVDNTYYCGSYFGYGLHEDAITSAINVAGLLGVDFN